MRYRYLVVGFLCRLPFLTDLYLLFIITIYDEINYYLFIIITFFNVEFFLYICALRTLVQYMDGLSWASIIRYCLLLYITTDQCNIKSQDLLLCSSITNALSWS